MLREARATTCHLPAIEEDWRRGEKISLMTVYLPLFPGTILQLFKERCKRSVGHPHMFPLNLKSLVAGGWNEPSQHKMPRL